MAGLEWTSFIKGGVDIFYAPQKPPKRDPPIVVAIIGIFVVLSIYGFFWALWNMGYSSYEFFSELDVTSPSGAVIALLSAFLVVATLYYVLFPEGQLARDAVAQRGAGRATFAHGDKRRA